MLLELYVVFGVLAFLLLCIGLWWREQFLVLGAGFIFFVLGLLIVGYGVDIASGKTIITENIYQNATMELNATPYPQYNLLNSTATETVNTTLAKDYVSGFVGLLLMGLGFYLCYLAYLDVKFKG